MYTAIPSQRSSSESNTDRECENVSSDGEIPTQIKCCQRQATYSKLLMPTILFSLICIIIIQWGLLVRIEAKTRERCFRSQAHEAQGLSYERNELRQIGSRSAYNSENETEADEAWNTMLTGHGVVSISEEYATKHNLVETLHHPIEPGGEPKHIYLIEAYHALHCIRMIRIHYRAYQNGKPWDWDVAHDYHCFDAIRQYVMCNPDYTLWYVSGHRVNGYMQMKMCQDWDAVREWAEDHTSNYFDSYDMIPNDDGLSIWYNHHFGDNLPIGSL